MEIRLIKGCFKTNYWYVFLKNVISDLKEMEVITPAPSFTL